LKALLVTLAPELGIELTDEERADTDLAHRRVCATLASAVQERGGPALMLLDNVDDPALLTRAAVSGGPAASRRSARHRDHAA
jgi:hypothetical protein